MKDDKPVKHSTGGWIFTMICFNLYIWHIAIPAKPTSIHWSVFECFLYFNLLGIAITYVMDCIIYWYKTNR